MHFRLSLIPLVLSGLFFPAAAHGQEPVEPPPSAAELRVISMMMRDFLPRRRDGGGVVRVGVSTNSSPSTEIASRQIKEDSLVDLRKDKTPRSRGRTANGKPGEAGGRGGASRETPKRVHAQEREEIEPAPRDEPKPTRRPNNRTTVLSNGHCWVAVPSAAILNVPRRFQDRVDADRNGELVSWEEFYQRNRGWLQPLVVRRDQLMGDSPLSQEAKKAYEQTGRVAVAIWRGRPVGVSVQTAVSMQDARPAFRKAL